MKLREVEQLSVAETAECLDLNEATVKTRLHRARHLMREDLVRLMGGGGTSLFEFGGDRCGLLVARVLAALRREGFVQDRPSNRARRTDPNGIGRVWRHE